MNDKLTSHPMGDFLTLETSSSSPHNLAATRARSLSHHHVLSGTLKSLCTFAARLLYPGSDQSEHGLVQAQTNEAATAVRDILVESFLHLH